MRSFLCALDCECDETSCFKFCLDFPKMRDCEWEHLTKINSFSPKLLLSQYFIAATELTIGQAPSSSRRAGSLHSPSACLLISFSVRADYAFLIPFALSSALAPLPSFLSTCLHGSVQSVWSHSEAAEFNTEKLRSRGICISQGSLIALSQWDNVESRKFIIRNLPFR